MLVITQPPKAKLYIVDMVNKECIGFAMSMKDKTDGRTRVGLDLSPNYRLVRDDILSEWKSKHPDVNFDYVER